MWAKSWRFTLTLHGHLHKVAEASGGVYGAGRTADGSKLLELVATSDQVRGSEFWGCFVCAVYTAWT